MYIVVQLPKDTALAGLKKVLAGTHGPAFLNYLANYLSNLTIHIKRYPYILQGYSYRQCVLLIIRGTVWFGAYGVRESPLLDTHRYVIY